MATSTHTIHCSLRAAAPQPEGSSMSTVPWKKSSPLLVSTAVLFCAAVPSEESPDLSAELATAGSAELGRLR